MTSRDPRVSPSAGDVLDRNGDRRVVLRVANDTVFYEDAEVVGFRFKSCWLTEWQAWAPGTVVVTQAEP